MLRRAARLSGTALLLALTCLTLDVSPSTAQPPLQPECLPLGAGSTGIPFAGGDIPSTESLSGDRPGFGPSVVGSDAEALELPHQVVFRTATETYSNDYAFALRDGHMYVASTTEGVVDQGETWHELLLPACLDGHVSAISADHNFLTVLGQGRQLYSHDMPGGDLSPERWTWRFGPYFWTGSGLTMWPDVTQWATSEFNASETFTDTSGRVQHPIGVGTLYLLRGDGRRITLLDPWLPTDQSRETCGPRGGRALLAALSASGSTVMVLDQDGRVWTRLYDFDISGANTVFGDYSWDRGRPADDTRWQLPGPGWVDQGRPRGVLTDLISIGKTGTDASDRVLRVEGRTRAGAGYFEKALDESRWHFVREGGDLTGQPIGTVDVLPGPKLTERRPYLGTIDGALARVRTFTAHCSETTTLRVQVSPKHSLRLLLHSSDGMRQETRDPGLTDVPREYNGAIEVPAPLWRHLESAPRAVRHWIATHLDGRFTTSPLSVTTTRMRFLAQCWELTLNGGAARPDQPALPPDGGVVVGRLTEMHEDGRTPSACAWTTP